MDFELEEPTQLTGVWEVPIDRKHEVPGSFSFERESGGILELWTAGTQLANSLYQQNLSIIVGQTSEGLAVTLAKCLLLTSSFSKLRFRVHTAIVGRRFADEESIRFKTVWVRFWLLNEWVGASSIQVEFKPSDSTWSASGGKPQPIQLGTHKGVNFRIVFDMQVTGMAAQLTKFKASHRAFLEASSDAPLTLDQAHEAVGVFSDFLMLGLGVATYPLSFAATPFVTAAEPHAGKLSLLYWPKYDGAKHVPLSRHLMIAPLDPTKVMRQFQQWLTFAHENSSIRNRFIANLLQPSAYLENRFLNVVQAAEQLHGVGFSNEVRAPAKHQQKVDRICSRLEKKDAKWVRYILDRANSKSLKEKLVELIRSGGLATKSYFADASDENTFGDDVANLRNRISHGRPYSDLSVDLFKLTMRTTRLVEIILLERAGFSHDEIASAIERRSAAGSLGQID